eukprot:TRINITY_DN5236_c0_g1_i7.p2 TRINITY_DN5236_c0_g1~~TRINITY_DN5236_c0_g1_i7.p2  ORF type:complete len:144 (+),score=11.45 TRINITY_DN5236_c0_g1_i7:61-492(+)
MCIRDSSGGYVWMIIDKPGLPTPTFNQMLHGLNGAGQPASASSYILAPSGTDLEFRLRGLDENQNYDLYIAVGNEEPSPYNFDTAPIQKLSVRGNGRIIVPGGLTTEQAVIAIESQHFNGGQLVHFSPFIVSMLLFCMSLFAF